MDSAWKRHCGYNYLVSYSAECWQVQPAWIIKGARILSLACMTQPRIIIIRFKMHGVKLSLHACMGVCVYVYTESKP